MKYLKHWKYQCMWAAPFIPWLLIHWVDWIEEVAQSLGFGSVDSGMITGIFTTIAIGIFIAGYIAVHDD